MLGLPRPPDGVGELPEDNQLPDGQVDKQSTMAPIQLSCPVLGCMGEREAGKSKTDLLEQDLAERMVQLHMSEVHPHPAPHNQPQTQSKTEKLVRPTLHLKDNMVEEETWNYFEHRSRQYKSQANLAVSVKGHLTDCLGDVVSSLIFSKLATTV